MTDEQFEYLLSVATERDKRRAVRMFKMFLWRLRHPKLSKLIDAIAQGAISCVR